MSRSLSAKNFSMTRFARLCCAGALLLSGCGAERSDERQAALRGSFGADHSAELPQTSLVQTRSKTRRMMSRDPEMLEHWQDSHQAVHADPNTVNATALLEISHSIDAKAFGDELHSLVDTESTRFVGTDGNVNTGQKIKDKFSKLGLQTRMEDLETTPALKKYVPSNATQKVAGNVVGVLKGTDLAHEVVIVGAHYDSVNWEKKGGRSPGVDDNGSGSALVQLVAKAMSQSAMKPRRSVMFVGFNAEEEGLVGSEQMAKKAKLGEYGDVKAVLIADEVAYPGSGSEPDRKAIFETVGDVAGASSLLDTFASNAACIAGDVAGASSLLDKSDGIKGFVVNNHGFGSDHMPFLQRKIPAMLLIERNNIAHSDTWGHSARDTYDHVDMAYGAAMSRLMLRAATALASPADVPTVPRVPGSVARHNL